MATLTTYLDTTLATAIRAQRKKAEASHKKSIGMGTMQGWESAEVLAVLDAAAARLEQLAELAPLLLPLLGPAAVRVPVVYLRGTQMEQITKLLNHERISKAEKTTHLRSLNTLREDEGEALIATLTARTAGPTPEQWDAIEAVLARSCFTDDARVQGRKQAAELLPASVAGHLAHLNKLADGLEQQLQTASTPEQARQKPPVAGATTSSHPALVATPYEQARQELLSLLRSEHVTDEERAKASLVVGELSEAELREKTKIVRRAITGRQTKLTAAA